ncbi:MAG: IS21 family transposase, partial [Chloroflexi bacterium]|nr:IS21 family transposase [Chloroflexota bacterium]
ADKQRILALLELGWSYRRIQRETGVDRETVARYDPKREPKSAKVPAGPLSNAARVPTGSQSACEPYRHVIETAVEKGLSAQRIWQDLRDDYRFSHGYDSVKRFVRRLKRRRREVVAVMEHPPGEEAQVDFFQGPPTLDPESGKWRRPWIFRMVLSCCGHSYEEPLWRQEKVAFMRAHENAFLDFGGVPRVVRLDNLKAGVARACLYDPDIAELYAAFAKHWGFIPLPCRPRHPQEQGVVERGGDYLKDNALKGRRFDSLEELDAFLKRWNRTVARVRIHGRTRKQVYTHFLEVEKPALKPLPAERFSFFEVGTRTVHPDGYVEVDCAYYAVPDRLLGEEVRVYWDERLVRIYHQDQCVGVYTKAPAGTFSGRDEYRPAHKPARQQAYQEYLLARAEHVGSRALAWAKAAIEERDVRAYRLLQGMISLTRKHPKERVDWACGIALENRLFRHKHLRRLVEQAAARAPAQLPLIQTHEIIRELSEYVEEVKV